MKSLLFVCTSLLLISCAEKKLELGDKPFTFTQEQKINEREIKDLVVIDSLNLDSLGIYTPAILDKTSKGLVFFDRSDRLVINVDEDLTITKTFKVPEGRGPGELGAIRRFDEEDGKLVFVDNGLNKLTHYSLEGDFLREFKVSGIPFMEVAKSIDNDRYLIASTFMTDSLYHLIDLEGNVLKRIQSSKEVDNPMMFTAQLKVFDNYLYLAGYSEPLIKKYNLENGALIYSKEMIDSYETTESYMSFSNGAGFTEDAIYGSIAITIENGLFYSARHHNGKKDYKFVDVYSESSGDYQFSYVLDNFINNESLAVDGTYMFTIETNSEGENLLMKYLFR